MGVLSISQKSKSSGGGGGDSAPKSDSAGLELWLKDGDRALVTIVTDGKEGTDDENRLMDYFYTHKIPISMNNGKTFWKQAVCKKRSEQYEDDDCAQCAMGTGGKWVFALWVYVHRIEHKVQSSTDWQPEQLPSGKTVFVETPEKYFAFAQGKGKNDYLWGNLVDIFEDNGSLNLWKTQIRRTGATQYDTSYGIQAKVGDEGDIPAKVGEDNLTPNDLPPIIKFFEYNENSGSDNGSNDSFDLGGDKKSGASNDAPWSIDDDDLGLPAVEKDEIL